MNNTPTTFTVMVLLFGSAAAGARESAVAVFLEPGATGADLLRAIGEQHPALTNETAVGRIAADHAFMDPAAPIDPEQELALISMVSGG